MTVFNINKLKLHQMTISELADYFEINRRQATMFHEAIMADYYTLCNSIAVKGGDQ